ncbi:MAG: zinc ribbon domain-containing protein [Candidatus Zixiibacteriota bacterium]|jgi:class 3 adenylate cyclase
MPTACPKCGRTISPAATFCAFCGAKTGDPAEVAAAVAAELAGLEMLGSQLSPDVLGELTEKFLSIADEVAGPFQGTITRENASAVTVTFPSTLPSPIIDAVSFALALRAAVQEMAASVVKSSRANPYLKMGVDARAEAAEENTPATSPVGGAKRLRNKASKWAVLAGETVVKATGDDFQYSTVGFYQARTGKPAVKIYQLQEDRRAPSAGGPPAPVPYVPVGGYEDSLITFLDNVQADRRRRLALVTGGTGSGKTTTLERGVAAAREAGFRVYAAPSFARRRYQPFGPWTQVWGEMLRDVSPDAPADVSPVAALETLDESFVTWAPLFGEMLGLPFEATPYAADTAPAIRHSRIIDVAVELVSRLAHERPTAVILDDYHFADPSSQEYLTALLAHDGDAPLAIMASSAAPDYALRRAADLTLSLAPLEESEVDAFAAAMDQADDGGRRLMPYARARGNPATLEQLWLLSREKSDAALLAARGGEAVGSAAVIGRRLRDFDKPWYLCTAALALVGIPVSDEDLLALANDALGGSGVAAESWRYKLYKLRFLRLPPGRENGRRVVPPHVAEAILKTLVPDPADRAVAGRYAVRFLAERYPLELSARAGLEAETGDVPEACVSARENVKRALWLGAPLTAADQLTAVIREIEKAPGPVKDKRCLLPELFLMRAEAFREAGLAAASLSDLEKAGTDDELFNTRKLLTQGRVYLLRDYYDEAEQVLLKALISGVKLENEPLVAEIELALAGLFARRGDRGKAVYELEKSLKTRPSSSPAPYRLMAELKYRTGRVAEAAKAARKAMALIDTSRSPVVAAEMGLSFAPVFFEIGQIPKARNVLRDSRDTFGVVGDSAKFCRTLVAEATLSLLVDDVLSSETLADEARHRAEFDGVDGCAATAALISGAAKLLRGDTEGYHLLLGKAAEATAGEKGGPAGAKLLEAAGAYYADEDYDRAYALADAAAAQYTEDGNATLRAVAVILAGWAALARGDEDLCQEMLGRPELERRARESKLFSAAYNKTAGALFAAGGDLRRARKYLRAAAAASREMGLWLVGGECYLDLAAIQEKESEREKYRRRARWLFESKHATLLAERAGRETVPPADRPGRPSGQLK